MVSPLPGRTGGNDGNPGRMHRAGDIHRIGNIAAERAIVPTLVIEGVGEYQVAQGKRLVLALTEDAGQDQLHACGGKARCTTCRVEFISGEPERITVAEKALLEARGLSGVRLSCQIACDQDMAVKVISRLEGSGRKDAGGPVTEEIEPPAEWTTR